MRHPIAEKLRKAAVGKPAKIKWPHRVLHEAADALDELITALDEWDEARKWDRITLSVATQVKLIQLSKKYSGKYQMTPVSS